MINRILKDPKFVEIGYSEKQLNDCKNGIFPKDDVLLKMVYEVNLAMNEVADKAVSNPIVNRIVNAINSEL